MSGPDAALTLLEVLRLLPFGEWGAALLGLFLIYLAWRAYDRRTPKGLEGVRLKPGDFGTCYVLRDPTLPNVYKIGLTRRRTATRRDEVSKDMAGGAGLKVVYAIDMPHAHAVERAAHRRMARKRVRWAPGHRQRGIEWFEAKGPRGLAALLDAVDGCAGDVRRLALKRGVWPENGDGIARSWKAGQRRQVFREGFAPHVADGDVANARKRVARSAAKSKSGGSSIRGRAR